MVLEWQNIYAQSRHDALIHKDEKDDVMRINELSKVNIVGDSKYNKHLSLIGC